MYPEERRHAMAALIRERGSLSVNVLATTYDVTTETVRRDLATLEGKGLVRRVHGGAVPAGSLSMFEVEVADRDLEHSDEKDRIAAAALSLLPGHGGSVLFDAGTSTARLAARLPHDAALTVITNAVPIAARLAGNPGVDLHLLPGRVRTTTQAAVGEDTVEALARLRCDVVFLGTNGFSLGHGLSTPDHSEAAAKRAMLHAAHRVILLVDSSKWGREHTVRFADLDQIDAVVTDSGADPAFIAQLRERGIEVVVA